MFSLPGRTTSTSSLDVCSSNNDAALVGARVITAGVFGNAVEVFRKAAEVFGIAVFRNAAGVFRNAVFRNAAGDFANPAGVSGNAAGEGGWDSLPITKEKKIIAEVKGFYKSHLKGHSLVTCTFHLHL